MNKFHYICDVPQCFLIAVLSCMGPWDDPWNQAHLWCWGISAVKRTD